MTGIVGVAKHWGSNWQPHAAGNSSSWSANVKSQLITCWPRQQTWVGSQPSPIDPLRLIAVIITTAGSLKLVWSCETALRIVNRGWFVEKEDDDHGRRKVQSHSDRVAESCHGPHCWFESKAVPSWNPQKLVMSISRTENWGYPKLTVFGSHRNTRMAQKEAGKLRTKRSWSMYKNSTPT